MCLQLLSNSSTTNYTHNFLKQTKLIQLLKLNQVSFLYNILLIYKKFKKIF